jgi:ArsR family transcriptional regulator, cadmium/lead-responsive transcriptional repressor
VNVASPAALKLQRQLLHGLSDRSRLEIVAALRGGELSVSDLVAETDLSQPNVSKHLACLWGCGLVSREQRGRAVFYRLIDGVDDLFAAVDAVLERAGDTFGACPLTEETLRGR